MSERLILEYMFYNCFSLIAVYLLSAHLHLYLFTWTILLVSFWLHRPEACGQTQSLFQQWPKILSCWHYFSLSSSLFNKPSGLLIVAIVVFLCMFVCVCVCVQISISSLWKAVRPDHGSVSCDLLAAVPVHHTDQSVAWRRPVLGQYSKSPQLIQHTLTVKYDIYQKKDKIHFNSEVVCVLSQYVSYGWTLYFSLSGERGPDSAVSDSLHSSCQRSPALSQAGLPEVLDGRGPRMNGLPLSPLILSSPFLSSSPLPSPLLPSTRTIHGQNQAAKTRRLHSDMTTLFLTVLCGAECWVLPTEEIPCIFHILVNIIQIFWYCEPTPH